MLIGVAFGGTHIKAGVVEAGEVVRTASASTPAGATPDQVLDQVAKAVLELSPSPDGVGVAIPGEVDGEGRCWRLTNVPGFAGVHVAEQLSQRLGDCPIAVENDATSAALGERLHGHGRTHASFLMVTLGTGIGGGLVLGHMLYSGSNGFATEFGHMNIDPSPQAPACACGRTGCVEAFAGSKAIVRQYHDLGGEEVSEVRPIAARARSGDPIALRAFEAAGAALGRGVAAVQNLLDLDAIAFSGGISGSFDLLETHVRRALVAHTFAPPLAGIPLLVSELGDNAGIVGAAYLTTL